MTEAEWMVWADPKAMLELLRDNATERKFRLFACACCRRVWPWLADVRSRRAVEVAEELTDGSVSLTDWSDAEAAAWHAMHEGGEGLLDTEDATARLMFHYASGAAFSAVQADFDRVDASSVAQDAANCASEKDQERRSQACLLRDIFGNPFRPVTFSPAWRIDTALTLARQMYDSREFSAMPIPADALQDAGCDNEDVLNHCRFSDVHVRGCWVVDLVLGKE